ncbi:MAG: GFA family protein [Rhodospirillaceae bacterium]|nr:GFA family protein [Rhodospirillaceae bacterium]
MSHCHCSICRKAHGAPFATYASTAQENYRLVAGADAIRQYESSPGFNRLFCGTCGSVVPEHIDGRAVIPTGCLDDDPGISAAMHIFVASKAPWYKITDDLPQHDTYPADSGLSEIAKPERDGAAPGHLHGSCLCGGVAYEVSAPFTVVHNCHCSRCRKSRAAAHTTNGFTAAEAVRFLKGEELLASYKVPDAKTYTPTFCRICGAGMPRLRPETGNAVIPMASLDDDPGRGADDHIFTGSKASWYEITGDLPQFHEMPSS